MILRFKSWLAGRLDMIAYACWELAWRLDKPDDTMD